MSGNNLVKIKVTYLDHIKHALLVADTKSEVWLPRITISTINPELEFCQTGDIVEIKCQEWIAVKNELTFKK